MKERTFMCPWTIRRGKAVACKVCAGRLLKGVQQLQVNDMGAHAVPQCDL